jgi:putative protease
MKNKIPKLLSPIKSYDGAVKVIQAGADEIYCGVNMHGLKGYDLYRGASCQIPSFHELGLIVKYAHENNVKVFVTINSPYSAKILENNIKNHIRSSIDQDIDALIIGDIGVLSIIKNMKINIPLIASTYMSTNNYESVNFLEKLGFKRVVLERHVTVDEIKNIVKKSNIEIEVFIHGSGCSNNNVNCYLYHYSFPKMNQALQSIDYIMVPCLLPFEIQNKNMETTQELFPILDAFTFCSMCFLPELIATGISGFKIVGRCLDEQYQENTTKTYRELLNLIELQQMDVFHEKINNFKKNFLPLPRNYPDITLKELCCDKKRCNYHSLSHTPYKQPTSGKTWTKTQFKTISGENK